MFIYNGNLFSTERWYYFADGVYEICIIDDVNTDGKDKKFGAYSEFMHILCT